MDSNDEAILREAKERGEAHALLSLLEPTRNRLFVADVLKTLGTIRDHPDVAPSIAEYIELDQRPAIQDAGIRPSPRSVMSVRRNRYGARPWSR
ncbi:MAG TPA: hypothetical protein VJT75_05820 [Thermoleophilaceae bacterium]|nr:hypothetical protein [Thermoleophilaceae bacterium]